MSIIYMEPKHPKAPILTTCPNIIRGQVCGGPFRSQGRDNLRCMKCWLAWPKKELRKRAKEGAKA